MKLSQIYLRELISIIANSNFFIFDPIKGSVYFLDVCDLKFRKNGVRGVLFGNIRNAEAKAVWRAISAKAAD